MAQEVLSSGDCVMLCTSKSIHRTQDSVHCTNSLLLCEISENGSEPVEDSLNGFEALSIDTLVLNVCKKINVL